MTISKSFDKNDDRVLKPYQSDLAHIFKNQTSLFKFCSIENSQCVP